MLALAIYLRAGSAAARKLPGRRPRKISAALVASLHRDLPLDRFAQARWWPCSPAPAGWRLARCRIQGESRARDLVLVSFLGVSILSMLALSSVRLPWEILEARWKNVQNVAALGNRVPIWEDAYRAWLADPMRTLFGAGTGAAQTTLGQFNAAAMVTDDGTLLRGTHSAYVEWGLSFGLFGMVPGLYLLLTMARCARQLDARDGGSLRQAILLSVLLWGGATPVFLAPLFDGRRQPGPRHALRPGPPRGKPSQSPLDPFISQRSQQDPSGGPPPRFAFCILHFALCILFRCVSRDRNGHHAERRLHLVVLHAAPISGGSIGGMNASVPRLVAAEQASPASRSAWSSRSAAAASRRASIFPSFIAKTSSTAAAVSICRRRSILRTWSFSIAPISPFT